MKPSGYRRIIAGMFTGYWKGCALEAEAQMDAIEAIIATVVSEQWAEYAGEVIDPVFKGHSAAWKVMDAVAELPVNSR